MPDDTDLQSMTPPNAERSGFAALVHSLAAFAVALLVIGAVAVVASSTMHTATAKTSSNSQVLPSPPAGGQEALPIPPPAQSANSSVTVKLHFHALRIFSGEALLQLDPSVGGVAVTVAPPSGGNRDVVLTVGSAPNVVTAVLIPHIRAGSNHDISVTVARSGSVTAAVDANQVFFYTFPTSSDFLNPSEVAVGSFVNGTQHFVGTISAVQLSTWSKSATPSGGTKSLLRTIGFALIAISLLELIGLGIVERRRVLLQFGLIDESDDVLTRDDELQPSRSPVWRSIALGAILIAGGALLLQNVTPPENLIVHRIGHQTLSTWTDPYGKITDYSLYSQPKLVANATAADIKLTFEFKANEFPNIPITVFDTGTNHQQMQLSLSPNGFFVSNTPLGGVGEYWPIAVGLFPGGEWIPVEIDVHRNRTLEFHFDHQLNYSYTFGTSAYTINPPVLSFGVPLRLATIAFRHTKLAATEYGPSSNTDGALRIRLLQLLGGLLVGFGAIVLFARFARKMVPRAPKSAKPLIKVAFGVAGAGLVANVLYLLTVKQTAAYYSNSTWLFALSARFSDYFQTMELFLSRNPYGIQRGSYPPFGYLILGPFAWMSSYAGVIAFLSIFVGFMVWWLCRAFTKGIGKTMTFVVLFASLFSLPVTFALDRANTAIFAAVFVILGGAALEQRKKALSSFYFALVGAAKIIPIFYLAVFFRWRRIRYIVLGFAFAGVVTLVSFRAFTGLSINDQISQLRFANDLTQQVNQNGQISTPFNTSIQGFVQAMGFAYGGVQSGQTITNIARHWVLLEEAIFAIVVGVYFFFFERTKWRLLTVATAMILLLPSTSEYYNLLFVFAPLALFVRHAPYNKRTIFIAVLFGMILMPKTYAFFGVGPYVDSSVLVTAPLLLTLTGATIYDFYAERKQQKQEQSLLAMEMPEEIDPVAEPVTLSPVDASI